MCLSLKHLIKTSQKREDKKQITENMNKNIKN